jgi:transposase-like protein
MAEDHPESPQRWTAKRRAALVLSIVKGETSAQAAARKHGLTVAEVEDWRDRFLLGAENALRARPKDEEALKDEQIKKLKQKVGELVLDLDVLKEASKDRPFAPKTSDEEGRCCRRSRNAGSARCLRWLAVRCAGPSWSPGGGPGASTSTS